VASSCHRNVKCHLPNYTALQPRRLYAFPHRHLDSEKEYSVTLWDQGLLWQANNSSTSQKNSFKFVDSMVHYLVYKSLPIRILDEMIPVHTLTFRLCMIILNISFPCMHRFLSSPSPLRFSNPLKLCGGHSSLEILTSAHQSTNCMCFSKFLMCMTT
jgi:hypothetical protein